MAGITTLLEDLARGQDRLAQHVDSLGRHIGRVVDRLDRLVEDQIADLRRRVERLERH